MKALLAAELGPAISAHPALHANISALPILNTSVLKTCSPIIISLGKISSGDN